MIEDLEKYCWDYLGDLEGLDSTLILQTLTESLKSSFDLPEELQCTYWSNILAKSASVVQSPFFVETHGSMISKLIKLDEFHVNEQTLWSRLVEWSASAVQKPELLGPFADATPAQPAKRAKMNDDNSNSSGPSETGQQEAILQLMSPHMRFIQMDKGFFIDKVRKHLDRKQIDAVTDYFLVGRKSEGLLTPEHVGLKDPDVPVEERQDFQESCGSGFNEKTLKFPKPVLVTKVELHSPLNLNQIEWSVSVANRTFDKCSTSSNWSGGQSTIAVSLADPCDELLVKVFGNRIDKVKSIRVIGRTVKGPLELANSVVQRLSKDLLVRPTQADNDSDQWYCCRKKGPDPRHPRVCADGPSGSVMAMGSIGVWSTVAVYCKSKYQIIWSSRFNNRHGFFSILCAFFGWLDRSLVLKQQHQKEQEGCMKHSSSL